MTTCCYPKSSKKPGKNGQAADRSETTENPYHYRPTLGHDEEVRYRNLNRSDYGKRAQSDEEGSEGIRVSPNRSSIRQGTY